MSQCGAKTRFGERCRNNAIPGHKFCYIASHGGRTAKFSQRFFNALQNHPLVLVVTIVASLITITGFGLYLRDQRLNTQAGKIEGPAFQNRRYLSVGSARFIIDEPNGTFLKDGDLPVLSLKERNGQLLVSTTIRDAEGHVVVEIKENEWAVNKNAAYDRNYTNDAFEVRDNRGKVALQIASLGDTIHVAGIFRCRSGWSAVFAPNKGNGALIDLRPRNVGPILEVEPMCQYPSALHFQACPGVTRLAGIVQHGLGPAYRLAGALDICTRK